MTILRNKKVAGKMTLIRSLHACLHRDSILRITHPPTHTLTQAHTHTHTHTPTQAQAHTHTNQHRVIQARTHTHLNDSHTSTEACNTLVQLLFLVFLLRVRCQVSDLLNTSLNLFLG